jgi:hypothetical protein
VSQQSGRCPVKRFILLILLGVPFALAQRGINLGGTSRGSVPPSGVNETDSLKDFHHLMAVEASNPQVTQFRSLMKTTETAHSELKALIANLQATKPDVLDASAMTTLDQALDNARGGNKQFVDGFSTNQRTGLKDLTKRLEKADSDLEQSQKRLDQIAHATNVSAPEATARVETLDKALTEFSDEQLALGREMSITLATAQDLSFTLPLVENPVSFGNRKITVRVSGELTQVAAAPQQRVFQLRLTAALADLQQNISDILQAQFQPSSSCGERVSVRRAMLMPATPASLLALRLHYERWACSRMASQITASEIAESDGEVEVKLTPAVDKPGTLQLASEFQRIDAGGMMGDSLRSGNLGDDVREKVSNSILAALRAGADFKATLPAAVQNDVALESATFEDSGAGKLSILLEGGVQISSEQVNLLASQLNQTASRQTAPAP